ncbi:hypothetical protein GUJ93_ZPchr0006g41093 [Zizania palustris]|uniref:Uncharacterized protein n=1 Tax=Zizania palustris TaxID=103762 RepID=A0A8J5SK53_ZIZPA|nr:hypothetical protein GUJ93_ZPchr0006g41093 [Zizania palustris]
MGGCGKNTMPLKPRSSSRHDSGPLSTPTRLHLARRRPAPPSPCAAAPASHVAVPPQASRPKTQIRRPSPDPGGPRQICHRPVLRRPPASGCAYFVAVPRAFTVPVPLQPRF